MDKPRAVDWSRIRTAKEAEIETLRDFRLSEVTPSRRDFTRFIQPGREDVGVIATIRRRDPYSGRAWADLDVAGTAAALDEADVPALAVTTEPLFHDGSLDDLRLAADASTAPLLRDDFVVAPLQLFQSRMHGADACTAPVGWIDRATLGEMVRTASSLHMALILGVFTAADLDLALPFDRNAVGVWAQHDDGAIDIETLAGICNRVPSQRTVILLSDVGDSNQWRALHGLVDAAIVARLWMNESDPAAALAGLIDD